MQARMSASACTDPFPFIIPRQVLQDQPNHIVGALLESCSCQATGPLNRLRVEDAIKCPPGRSVAGAIVSIETCNIAEQLVVTAEDTQPVTCKGVAWYFVASLQALAATLDLELLPEL